MYAELFTFTKINENSGIIMLYVLEKRPNGSKLSEKVSVYSTLL